MTHLKPSLFSIPLSKLALALLTALCSTLVGSFTFGASVSTASATAETLSAITASELSKMLKAPGTKATAVNLWASWCAPCKDELPALVAFKKKYADQGVKLILISADSKDDIPAAVKVLKEAGVDFQTYHLAEDPEVFMKNYVDNWGAILPTSLLFDASGKRRALQVGKLKFPEFEKDLDQVLKGEKGEKKKGSK
jgi:thiol-disulfide isomerase/thioredoxin